MDPKTILEISESSHEAVGKGPKLLQVNSQKTLKTLNKAKNKYVSYNAYRIFAKVMLVVSTYRCIEIF